MAERRNINDYSIEGGIDTNGEFFVLNGSEALANSIRMWLSSYRGEVIRQPELGGLIVNLLMKPMSEDIALDLQAELIEGFESDFSPYIRLSRLQVIPDYDNESWEIRIEGYSPELKQNVILSERLRGVIV